MEKSLERYYTEFKRPPFAPTYTPTEEEFADPIFYVAKIRPEAEKYGLVKIIPPKSFHPPFCIDSSKFEFTPRVQRLNEIDALFRLRIIFINKLVKFWQIHGQPFRIPYIDNKYIDLYKLRQLVFEEGGQKKVTDAKKWAQIAKTLGFKSNAGPSMKYHYGKWIHPFELMSTAATDVDVVDEHDEQQPSTSSTAEERSAKEEEKSSPQTRSQSRMMAGMTKRKVKPVPSLDQSSIKSHHTHIELVVCAKCRSGDDEARLLLCETCDSSLHTYCANPPMQAVPKGEWRCQKCVANALKSVSTDFGFIDSNQHFNLNNFGEWANNYKQQYFKQAPCDVSGDEVEAEFWRNVIDIDKAVQVKYGADLISSKVGSGFPRREDNFRGVNAKEKQLYANHPWNLNNLPKLRESVLCHMETDISGMMVPWVYVGMLFSTFCWHVEDHWTYSINYNHWGERKIWYGIPGEQAENFDRVMRESVPSLFEDQNDLLHHMTTALNPRFLIDHGVPVYTLHQSAGEFVVTFPRSYHAGYNEGLNFAEAVNFAPPDWLRMGRQCLENYAKVHRNCVFSHEELVMKMVSVSNKMSIGMCLATLEELTWIVAKETDFRKKLTAAGLRESQFCKFEELSDDDRACAFCRTTLFCSGLVCRHEGRIVCTQHVDKLCDQCQVAEFCLKFRYTLEDLVPMVRRLSERTNAFFEWKRNVAELCSVVKEVEGRWEIASATAVDGGGGPSNGLSTPLNRQSRKIDVPRMRALAEQWRTSRFPHCEEIHRINRMVADFERLATSINKVLNRKIRLRDQTRCQKADTRCEYEEVLILRKQLEESIFEDRELRFGLEEICTKAEGWKQRMQKALTDEFCGVKSVDCLYQLIYEAEEEFNIRLESEGLDRLKNELTRCQWLVKAQKVLEQVDRLNRQNLPVKKAADGLKDELKAGGEQHQGQRATAEHGQRLSLDRLEKLIADTTKWPSLCPVVKGTVERLERIFADGTAADAEAATFLASSEGQGVERAEECWSGKLAEGAGWVESEAMDSFRAELDLARQIHAEFLASVHAEGGACTLRRLEQLGQHCSSSLFERNGQRHEKVKALLTSTGTFVERVRTIFQKAVNYYSIFDIIAGRSDLPALVEGDPMPLGLFTSAKYSDNWRNLRIFDSQHQLLVHLNAITEQQSTLLHALRLANEQRPMKETCSCARDEAPHLAGGNKPTSSSKSGSSTALAKVEPSAADTISCFICNASFHGACAQWDAFLARLPAGIFLCPRCLRSRRPCVEDVEAACLSSSLPDNCLEKMLVQNLVHRSTSTFGQLQRLLHAIPKGAALETISEASKLSLREWLTMALSLEVVDTEVYSTLAQSAYFDLFPIPPGHIAVWQKIKERMVHAEPLPVIFSLSLPSSSNCAQSHGPGRRLSGTKRRGNHLATKNRRKSREEKSMAVKVEGWVDEGSDSGIRMEEEEEEDGHGTDGGGKKTKKWSSSKGDSNGGSGMEKCAADFCLKPYSEYTRWIQCEAGCARWYHFCCVGISVRGAQLISSYCCYKCSSSTTSSSSAQK